MLMLLRPSIPDIFESRPGLSIAEKRNKANIAKGKVRLLHGNFDEIQFEKGHYDKVCSVNTI